MDVISLYHIVSGFHSLDLILQQVDHVHNPVYVSADISVETRVTATSGHNTNTITVNLARW